MYSDKDNSSPMRMRAVILFFALVTASASAQDVTVSAVFAEPDLVVADGYAAVDMAVRSAPTPSEQLVLYLSGAAGGVLSPAILGNTLNEGWLTIVSIPVGSALGVHVASQAYGLEGGFAGALGNATLGFGLGVAAGGLATFAICGGGVACTPGSVRLGAVLLSTAALATLTPGLVAAYRRIGLNARVEPTLAIDISGETVPALSLRIGL